MYRDFLTNRWVLGGVGFLIVLSVACVLWYQHDIAPHRKAAADAQELLRQSEIAKKASDADSVTEQAASVTLAESKTPTTEKPINLTTDGEVEDTPSSETFTNLTELAQAKDSTQEVRVSPYGFGPYPKVPEDYPSTVSWKRDQTYLPEELRPQSELLSRVLVQLWTEGDKNFRGGSTYNGKIYPHYHDTVYVRFAEYEGPDGKMVRYPARGKSGPTVKYTEADLLDPPPHLRILDLDSSGIDPYQYLGLP